jgi:hypothetical protein
MWRDQDMGSLGVNRMSMDRLTFELLVSSFVDGEQ